MRRQNPTLEGIECSGSFLKPSAALFKERHKILSKTTITSDIGKKSDMLMCQVISDFDFSEEPLEHHHNWYAGCFEQGEVGHHLTIHLGIKIIKALWECEWWYVSRRVIFKPAKVHDIG